MSEAKPSGYERPEAEGRNQNAGQDAPRRTLLRRRTPRDELAEGTAHGDVYLRRLRRAQLALTLVSLIAFGALIGALPALLALAPVLRRIDVIGVPLADWLVIGPLFPLLVAIGWIYQRRADSLDDAFRDLVRDE